MDNPEEKRQKNQRRRNTLPSLPFPPAGLEHNFPSKPGENYTRFETSIPPLVSKGSWLKPLGPSSSLCSPQKFLFRRPPWLRPRPRGIFPPAPPGHRRLPDLPFKEKTHKREKMKPTQARGTLGERVESITELRQNSQTRKAFLTLSLQGKV